MDKNGQGFPKADRVRSKPEIDRVFRSGARYSCKGMRIHIAQNSLENSRAVFVPVRSFAGSVQRNRAKRLAREAWRLDKSRIKPGYDVAFVMFPDEAGLPEYRSRMAQLLRKAGILAGMRA
ncbi:MAG: ribonuclease P protein component [Rectinema sp.]